jgi:plasmanylethanolamine desaturase
MKTGGGRSRAVVGLEVAAVAVCLAALASLIARGAGSLRGAREAAVLGLAALCGYLAADLASGLVHWFCDRFFEEDSPYLGRLLIRPFREHHRDPAAMTRHGWLELCGNSAQALVPLLLAVLAAPLPAGAGLVATFVDGATVAFALAALATNAFHCWAHAPRVPPLVARLQSLGLILGPRAHAVHHAGGGAYCVTSGWANRVVDGLALPARLERGLVALGLPATRHP